ncbi:MAG: sulfatase-like hydrolase/transferase [candidate division Zixibacteria bacterium]|nr:sulfatase-like hydrolase/transferase [candidate division Zixibacteria bacterium]
MARILRRVVAWAAFAAAVGFFWGATEAFINYRWAPKGVWRPDLWLPSTYNRVIFYAVVVGALAVLAEGVKGLMALIGRRGGGERRWRGPVAVAAVVASNAGWLVLGLIDGYELNLGVLKLDVQEAGPFFAYWAYYAVAGAGLALGLGFGLGGRRWARAVGRYAQVVGAALFVALIISRFVDGARRPRPRGPNVVLIVLDAWRADAFRPDLTPNLYAYGRENALVFERAWSNATWTLPAMRTAFTGQYPDKNVTRRRRRAKVECPTLAQSLRAAGYETVAFSANRILNRDSPITDGFENFYFTDWLPFLREVHFYDTNWYAPAVRELFHGEPSYKESLILTGMLRSYLRRPHRRPYFLWAHYMDPHGPYMPPPGYYAPADEKYILDYRPCVRKRRHALKRLYDGECKFVDDLFGSILPLLAAQTRTIIVITSDHGEEFWEHKMHTFGHGKSVYDTLTRIPLIISIPGKTPGVVKTQVSLVDLAPTLLVLAGREPPRTMQGRPFFTPDGRAVAGRRPVFIGSFFFKLLEGKPERQNAVVAWPRKLIVYHKRPSAPGEYYDLAADPAESRRLPEDVTAARLRESLTAWQAGVTREYESPDYEGAAAPDLRALGYIR